MNKQNMIEWIQELESGDRIQTNAYLTKELDEDTLAHCCLGVGCELIRDILGTELIRASDGSVVVSYNDETTIPPPDFYTWLGFTSVEIIRIPWQVAEAVNTLNHPDRPFVWVFRNSDPSTEGEGFSSFREYVNKHAPGFDPGVTWFNDVKDDQDNHLFNFSDIALMLRMTFGVWT